MEEFIPHHMDRKQLRKYYADTDNLAFREDYEAAQALWKRAGHVGGLDEGFLFGLCLKYQKPELTKQLVEAEPVETAPEKKKRGRPRKLAEV